MFSTDVYVRRCAHFQIEGLPGRETTQHEVCARSLNASVHSSMSVRAPIWKCAFTILSQSDRKVGLRVYEGFAHFPKC